MKLLVILIFTFGLLGCTRGFAKKGATYQDFYEDLQDCNKLTYKSPILSHGTSINIIANSGNNNSNSFLNRRTNTGNRNNCMKYKNWEIRRGNDVFHP